MSPYMEPIGTRSELDKRMLLDSRTAAACSHAASPRHPNSPHSREKPAWVVADWKRRVPETPLPGPAAKAGRLNSQQREKMVAERRKQLHSEYAGVHDTINSILSRCKQVQQRLGSSSTLIPSSSSSSHSPTCLSMRSQLLFEAPQVVDAGSGNAFQEQATAAARPAGGPSSAVEAEQQQQQRPVSPAWGGAVDLNPAGYFSFPPRTPERLAAICPDELPLVLSHFTGLLHDIKAVDLGQLHHREVLQAGIQQLNGEFYAALLAAAGNQHAEEMRRSNRQGGQGVIPASWLRA